MRVFGLYNWNTNAAMAVDYPAAYAGLDPAKTYVGFDFWNDRFVPAFKGRFKAEVPADDCRIVALREFDGTKPVVVSSSRHVASPVFDVMDEKWNASTKTLSGVSRVVPGERYELRVVLPEGMRYFPADAGTGASGQKGTELRIAFQPEEKTLRWRIALR